MTRRARFIAALAFTLLFAGLLTWRLDLGDFTHALSRARFENFVYVALLFPALAIVRAWRLALLLGRRMDWNCFAISTIYAFMASLMPSRLGEAALPLLLGRYYGTRLVEGSGLLLVMRLYDLFAVMTLSGLTAFLVAAKEGPLVQAASLLLAGTSLVAALILPWALALLRSRPWRLQGFIERLTGTAEILASLRIRLLLILGSLVSFLINFSMFDLCAQAFGISPGFAGSVLAGSGAVFAFVLPFNGFANFGPFEVTWAALLKYQGIAFDAALVSGLAIHVVILLVSGLLALACVVSPAGERAWRKPSEAGPG
jgi:uncharacterized membrane protein YbhN (UPF0104 family)